MCLCVCVLNFHEDIRDTIARLSFLVCASEVLHYIAYIFILFKTLMYNIFTYFLTSLHNLKIHHTVSKLSGKPVLQLNVISGWGQIL